MGRASDADYERRIGFVLGRIPLQENHRQLRRYLDEKRANGVKPPTLLNDATALRDLAVHLGDTRFEDATKDDILSFANQRNRTRSWRIVRKDGTQTTRTKEVTLRRSTMAVRNGTLRHFFKWLKGDGEEYPKEVKWLKSTRPKEDAIATDRLVTSDELHALLQAHPDPREKAMLAVLYESGLRAGELCALNIGNVEFDEYGAVLLLPKRASGLKTGARRIRLYHSESVPYLQAWYETHPDRDKPSAPLFHSMSRRAPKARFTPGALWQFIQRACKRTGIDRGLKPHDFRHTAATEKARLGWTEAEMRAFFGWTRGSDMPATYVHLAGKDYEEMDLERRGLKKPGQATRRSALAPRTCKICKAANLSTSAFCQNCRAPVSPKAEAELQARRKEEMKEQLAVLVASQMKEEIAEQVRGLMDGGSRPLRSEI